MAPRRRELTAAEKKLFDVIVHGNVEEVQTLLKDPDVQVDCLDETGMTPLQHCAFRGKKELCNLFLQHGADVNSNYHENGYSTLMFAALSGNAEVTRMMLEAGANVNHINSVNRTASQMAAFVGQHQCVLVIKNFFPREELDYYTAPQGLETEPKLSPELAPDLLTLINMINLHPVKLSLFLQDHMTLVEGSKSVVKVLELLVEKSIKSREMDEVLAIKLHYMATLVRLAARSQQDKQDNLASWVKSLVRGRERDGFPEKAECLIRQSLKEFPYVECQLLQQLVRQISKIKIGDQPSALATFKSMLNGRQFSFDEDTSCDTCGDSGSEKSCSACRSVMYCSQRCQRLHWPTHKKFCQQLAEEQARLQQAKERHAQEEASLAAALVQTNLGDQTDAGQTERKEGNGVQQEEGSEEPKEGSAQELEESSREQVCPRMESQSCTAETTAS